MKDIKKNVVLLISIVALVVSSFAGCGEKKEKLKTVEVWSADSHSKIVMKEIIDDWNETKGKEMGVKIKYTVKEGDIQQATEMAFASEQGPDLFSSCKVEKNRVAGNIFAIDELKGGKEWIDSKFSPDEYNSSEFMGEDGKIYTLPNTILSFGLVYNKDMFKKYGIVDKNGEPTPPKTFEQVREYAKKMTNEKEQDYGIIFPMKWGGFCSTDVLSLTYGSSGKSVYDCVNGEYDFSVLKPILEMYTGIIRDKSCFPSPESLDNDMARAYFAERNIGMKFAGSFDVGVFNSQFPAKCDWGVAPYPVSDEKNEYKRKMIVGGGYAISRKAVERLGEDVSLELIKFFYGDDMAKRLFKEGMALTVNKNATKNVSYKENMKGWKEFQDIVAISTGGYESPSTDITGLKTAEQVIVEDVFTGKVDIDSALSMLTKQYNDGITKYYKANPDRDAAKYKNKEWNIKLK